MAEAQSFEVIQPRVEVITPFCVAIDKVIKQLEEETRFQSSIENFREISSYAHDLRNGAVRLNRMMVITSNSKNPKLVFYTSLKPDTCLAITLRPHGITFSLEETIKDRPGRFVGKAAVRFDEVKKRTPEGRTLDNIVVQTEAGVQSKKATYPDLSPSVNSLAKTREFFTPFLLRLVS